MFESIKSDISILGQPMESLSGPARAVKKFSSSRLIMNSRRLWNSHYRHKFLRVKASRDILKFSASAMAFPGDFQCRCYHVSSEYLQAFHDMARFEHFTDLNLFKYAFDVIQNCETDALQFILFDGAYVLFAVMVEGDESSWQFWPATGLF